MLPYWCMYFLMNLLATVFTELHNRYAHLRPQTAHLAEQLSSIETLQLKLAGSQGRPQDIWASYLGT